MQPILLLSGFEPFGGERINPSWEIARRLEDQMVGRLRVKSLRLPVHCARAAGRMAVTVTRYRPAAMLVLGQAAGATAIRLEQVALNLAQQRTGGRIDGRADAKPVVPGGPDAYFSRLPLGAILGAMRRRGIPAEISLSAGAYACNAVMYAGLHALSRRPGVPAGLIHLPYEIHQAARHSDAPSMALDVMERAVRLAVAVIARKV